MHRSRAAAATIPSPEEVFIVGDAERTEECSAPSGAPALGAASLADSWEVVKILIEQGVDVKSDAGGAALIRDHSQPRASAGNGRRGTSERTQSSGSAELPVLWGAEEVEAGPPA